MNRVRHGVSIDRTASLSCGEIVRFVRTPTIPMQVLIRKYGVSQSVRTSPYRYSCSILRLEFRVEKNRPQYTYKYLICSFVCYMTYKVPHMNNVYFFFRTLTFVVKSAISTTAVERDELTSGMQDIGGRA